MNFKSFFQFFIFVFLSILSLSTCYLQISTLKNKYRMYYPSMYTDKENYDFTSKICHNERSSGNYMNLITDISDVKNLNQWNKSFFNFLYSSSNDEKNITNFIKPYNNSLVEIWQNKKCNDKRIFVVREKIIKLINFYTRCPNEADFLFQSHIYCMIKNFLNQELSYGELSNCFNELTKIANLFFLAEKHQVNILTRLVFECNSETKENLQKYILSVARIPGNRKNNLIDITFTKFPLKNEFFISNNKNINNEINDFNPKNYKCDIIFYINKNSSDDIFLNYIHNEYYEEAKEKYSLKNNTIEIIIAEKEIEYSLEKTSNFETVLKNTEVENADQVSQSNSIKNNENSTEKDELVSFNKK